MPGQRAIADAVSVHVFVTGETAEAVEIFFAQHLAALDRLLRIFERIGHPVVHAEIEIGHDEDQRLKLLGQIEGVSRAMLKHSSAEHGISRMCLVSP